MKIILGFIIMLILVVVSSIPIFITLKLKTSYGNVIAWVLFTVCCLLYVVLKFVCIEFGILNESSTPIPIIAMFIFYFLSRLGVIETDKK